MTRQTGPALSTFRQRRFTAGSSPLKPRSLFRLSCSPVSAACPRLATLGGRTRPAVAANEVQDDSSHRPSQAEEDPQNTSGNAKSQHPIPLESTAMYPADYLVDDPPLITKRVT